MRAGALVLIGYLGAVLVAASTPASGWQPNFSASASRERHPRPSAEAIRRAEEEVLKVYSRQHISENLPDLVVKNADRPARVFVLCDAAANECLRQGEFDRALGCLLELARHIDLDLAAEALRRFSQAAEEAERVKPLSERRHRCASLFAAVDGLVDEIIATRNFGACNQACSLLDRIASMAPKGASSDAERLKDASKAASLRVDRAARAFAQAAKARQRLDKNPGDKDAQEIVGLWLGLYERDWKTAVKHLKRGKTACLQQAASLESTAVANLDPRGEDAYAVAAAWKEVSGDPVVFADAGPWRPGRRSLLHHEKSWLDKAVAAGFVNEIDRTLAWRRRQEVEDELGSSPHTVVGKWAMAPGQQGWVRTFQRNGIVLFQHPDGRSGSGLWRPESESRVHVTVNAGWTWNCSGAADDQLLVEEFDPEGKRAFSALHRRVR